jgi:hypothetical protein
LKWFEACSWKPTSEGHYSSISYIAWLRHRGNL